MLKYNIVKKFLAISIAMILLLLNAEIVNFSVLFNITASPSFTVTFQGNGGLWPGNRSQTQATTNSQGLVISYESGLARSGWEFRGWYTSSTVQTVATRVTLPLSPVQNMTVWAGWDDHRPSQVITFNLFTFPAGTTPIHTVQMTVRQGAGDVRPNVSNPVYGGGNAFFSAWYTTSTFDNQFSGAVFNGTQPRTINLYARFSRQINFIVPGRGIQPRPFPIDQLQSTFNPIMGLTPSFMLTNINGGDSFYANHTVSGWYTNNAFTTRAPNLAGNINVINNNLCPATGLAFIGGVARAYARASLTNTTRVRVTIDYNNGVTPSRYFYVYNGSRLRSISPPAHPSGLMFSGWYYENTRWLFGQNNGGTVTRDITLVARYVPQPRRVDFNLHGGTVGGSPTLPFVTINDGEFLPQPQTPVCSGFVFGGWFDSATNQVVTSWPLLINSNRTLHAIWHQPGAGNGSGNGSGGGNISFVTVTFNANSGTPNNRGPFTVQSGIPFPNLFAQGFVQQNPTRNQHVFVGWEHNGVPWNFGVDSTTTNLILTARWAPLFTVEYVGFRVFSSIAENENTPLLGFTPTQVGYLFQGWEYGTAGNRPLWDGQGVLPITHIIAAGGAVGQTIRIRPVWLRLPDVTFIHNNGTNMINIHSTYETAEGSGVFRVPFPPNPVRAGYLFGGWFTDVENDNTQHMRYDAVIGNKVLLARWIPSGIYITYNPNDDGINANIISNEVIGRLITQPVPVFPPNDQGERIISWHIDPDGLTPAIDFRSEIVTGSMTLYAQWGIVNYIIVRLYNPFGVHIGNINVPYGSTLEGRTPAFERDARYNFEQDWYFYPGLIWNFFDYAVTTEINLTMRVSHDVRFNSNGGSLVSIPPIIRGNAVVEPPRPILGGQEFLGWYTDQGFTQRWNFLGTEPTDLVWEHRTLFARWGEVPINHPPIITHVIDEDSEYDVDHNITTNTITLAVAYNDTGRLFFHIEDDGQPFEILEYSLIMSDGGFLPPSVSYYFLSNGFSPQVQPDGTIVERIEIIFNPIMTELDNIYLLRLYIRDGDLTTHVNIRLVVTAPPGGGVYVVFLLDVSAGMANVASTANSIITTESAPLINHASANHVAIVIFSDSASDALGGFTRNMEQINFALNTSSFSYSTNMYAAFVLAQTLLEGAPADAEKRIIVLSDGLINMPRTQEFIPIDSERYLTPYTMQQYLFWRQANLTHNFAVSLHDRFYIEPRFINTQQNEWRFGQYFMQNLGGGPSRLSSFNDPENIINDIDSEYETALYLMSVLSIGDGASVNAEHLSGEAVIITSGIPPIGHQFSHWSSIPLIVFEDRYSMTANFIMPHGAITVIANFIAPPINEGEPLEPPINESTLYSAVLAPEIFTFPAAKIGFNNTTMIHPFTFTNTGNQPLTSLTATFGLGSFELATPFYAGEIAPGESITLWVRPIGGLPAGEYFDALVIRADYIELAAVLSFTVSDTAVYAASAEPGYVIFYAQVGYSADEIAQDIQIANTGTEVLTNVQAVFETGAYFTLGALPAVTITTGSALTIRVQPVDGLPARAVAYTDILRITADNGVDIAVPLTLTVGYDVIYAALITPVMHTFPGALAGYNPATIAQEFIITNVGTGLLTGFMTLFTNNYFTLLTTLPDTLAVGESAAVVIAPVAGLIAQAAAYADVLTITGNNGIILEATLSFTVAAAADDIVLGDLTGTGTVDMADLIVMLQFFAQPGVDINLAAADVNQDGVVDMADLILLLRFFSQPGVVLGAQ